MKRLTLILIVTLSLSVCYSQTNNDKPVSNTEFTYKLYPTSNHWTFIKLDTSNGKMWQVQFSIEGANYRFETDLNLIDFAEIGGGKAENGRFELYSTQNIYNFILLDKATGQTYQVQWGERKNRAVIPIF